jgi:hypothetical protein
MGVTNNSCARATTLMLPMLLVLAATLIRLETHEQREAPSPGSACARRMVGGPAPAPHLSRGASAASPP